MQAKVRTKVTHDPSSMEGQSYVPHSLFLKVETSGSGVLNLWYAPDGCYVQEVVGYIKAGLDAGIVDVGWVGDDDGLIDNTEWTEGTDGQFISSRVTTATSGKFFEDGTQLILTVTESSGVPTEGEIWLLIKYMNFDEMAAEAFHNELSGPA